MSQGVECYSCLPKTAWPSDFNSKVNGAASSFDVYTDNAGNYIDADYNLGKIPVVLTDGTTTDAAVYVKNKSDRSHVVL